MSVARIAAINLECPDPAVLADFCAALLGGEVVLTTADFCAVQAGSMVPRRLPRRRLLPPTWPSVERSQQLHLDLAVDDLDDTEADALRLGATKESEQPSPERSRVLRDPAGHPFCLRA